MDKISHVRNFLAKRDLDEVGFLEEDVLRASDGYGGVRFLDTLVEFDRIKSIDFEFEESKESDPKDMWNGVSAEVVLTNEDNVDLQYRTDLRVEYELNEQREEHVMMGVVVESEFLEISQNGQTISRNEDLEERPVRFFSNDLLKEVIVQYEECLREGDRDFVDEKFIRNLIPDILV